MSRFLEIWRLLRGRSTLWDRNIYFYIGQGCICRIFSLFSGNLVRIICVNCIGIIAHSEKLVRVTIAWAIGLSIAVATGLPVAVSFWSGLWVIHCCRHWGNYWRVHYHAMVTGFPIAVSFAMAIGLSIGVSTGLSIAVSIEVTIGLSIAVGTGVTIGESITMPWPLGCPLLKPFPWPFGQLTLRMTGFFLKVSSCLRRQICSVKRTERKTSMAAFLFSVCFSAPADKNVKEKGKKRRQVSVLV